MSNLKFAAALRAAAAVLESGEDTATVAAPAAPSLGSKIADFLRNDDSSFEWRSAGAIAKALGANEGEVSDAANASSELRTKQSQRSGMGLLITLA